ncbi:MAG TPA: hypothetical protein ENI60_05245 [Candidatus Fraserbacteria bacterium]|nr:hypothetical protein [Candidatus Fraserbacteria bacterium]
MRRTNIVLEEWQYEYLKERSQQEGVSMSALVRKLIRQDPIFSIVGMFRGERKDVAERHDDYLYTMEEQRR